VTHTDTTTLTDTQTDTQTVTAADDGTTAIATETETDTATHTDASTERGEPWPEAITPTSSPVTLVAEGRPLSVGEILTLRTGPAGRDGAVSVDLLITNRSAAVIEFDAPDAWLPGADTSVLHWETPPPALLAPEATAVMTLVANGRTLLAATTMAAQLTVPGTSMQLTVRVEIPRPLRLLLAGDGGFVAASDDGGASFTTVAPASGATDPTRVRSLDWGEGRFFFSNAAGQAWGAVGLYATSTDGASWSPSAVAAEGWPSDCLHAFDKFLCVRGDAFSTSEDGRVVVHEPTRWTPMITSLASDGTQVVGVGRNGRRSITRDGVTWSEDNPDDVSHEYNGVVYGGGRWVAVGGLNNYVISTSIDGRSWTDQTWAPSQWARLTSVAWNGTQFLASGINNDAPQVWRSVDGAQWENALTPTDRDSYTLLGAFDGYFYGVRATGGLNRLWRSTDGAVWTDVLSVPASQALRAMAMEGIDRADDATVPRGDDEITPAPPAADDEPACAGLQLEVDGQTLPMPARYDFGERPAYADPQRVAVTLHNPCDREIRLMGHPDAWIEGEVFRLETLPPLSLAPGARAQVSLMFTPDTTSIHIGALRVPHDGPHSPLQVALAAESGPPLRVVGVGDRGYRFATDDYGATLMGESSTTVTAHTRDLIRGACWGNGRFVGVGGNAETVSWVSTDGVTWQDTETPGPPLADCAFGNGRFVGAGGSPHTSTDGIIWTAGSGSAPNHLRTMAFGDGVFVGAGDAGQLVTTTDGTTWERVLTIGSDGFQASVYGAGRFVVAGANGAVAASSDGGATWLLRRINGAGTLGGLAFAGGRFFTGNGSSIYVSADGLSWTRVNGASVRPMLGVGSLLLGWGDNAVQRSTDGGFSWTKLAAGATGLGPLDFAVEQR